jgi:hypothetical protein
MVRQDLATGRDRIGEVKSPTRDEYIRPKHLGIHCIEDSE